MTSLRLFLPLNLLCNNNVIRLPDDCAIIPCMELTIGVLSFNTIDLLRKCLKTIYKETKNIRYEIIVVDNASHDGSAMMVKNEFPNVKLICNRKNRFFAAGYNQIIKLTKGKYFVMLNSDTYLENNAFSKIMSFMKKNNLSACEGLEIKPNGKIISTGSLFRSPLSDFYELSFIGRLFKNKKYLNKIRMKKYNRRKNFEIDVGCNAYFCAKTSVLHEIKGYDEKFFLYYTEDDISQRIKGRGYKIFHCGESFVIHEDAKSTMQLGWKRVDMFYKDLLVYHSKYNSRILSYILFYLLNIEKMIIMIFRSNNSNRRK